MEQVTDQQIADWQKTHGEIYLIEVTEAPIDFESDLVGTIDPDALTVKGYLKKPDTRTQSLAYAKMQDSPLAGGEVILKQCWLGGDDRLLNNPSFKSAAALKAIALAEFRMATLKKL